MDILETMNLPNQEFDASIFPKPTNLKEQIAAWREICSPESDPMSFMLKTIEHLFQTRAEIVEECAAKCDARCAAFQENRRNAMRDKNYEAALMFHLAGEESAFCASAIRAIKGEG